MASGDAFTRYMTGAVLPLYETTDDQAARVVRGGKDPLLPENRDFVYPDRRPRASGPSHAPLDRGYIRSVADAENKLGLPSVKCQFQFNPEVLTHSIAQRSDMLNFFAMTPADFATPIGGNVNFNFSMIFDRSMELSKRESNPAPESPEEIGVLHDINTLYKVIGVGMNSDYARAADERSYVNQAIRASSGLTSDDDTEDENGDQPDADTALGNVEEYLRKNEGNHAFLIPLPVRVVFSEHYMVEGLVQNVDVTYGKFNRNMVPMQCSVGVTMEAKYLGFYKTNTFFTDMLEQFGEEEFEAETSFSEDSDYSEALLNDLSSVTMFLHQAGTGYRLTASSGYPLRYENASTRPLATSNINNLVSNDVAHIEETDHVVRLFFSPQNGVSKLSEIAEDNKSVSLDISGDVSLYRYHSSLIGLDGPLAEDYPRSKLAKRSAINAVVTTSDSKPALKFIRALEDWHSDHSDSGYPDSDSDLFVVFPDEGGDDRFFAKAQKVGTFKLDYDVLSTDFMAHNKIELPASVNSQLRNLIAGDPNDSRYKSIGLATAGGEGVTLFNPYRGTNSNAVIDDVYDKSVQISQDGVDYSAGHVLNPDTTGSGGDWFSFAIEFKLRLTVVIEGATERVEYHDGLVFGQPVSNTQGHWRPDDLPSERLAAITFQSNATPTIGGSTGDSLGNLSPSPIVDLDVIRAQNARS
jgi:hypothetical protein